MGSDRERRYAAPIDDTAGDRSLDRASEPATIGSDETEGRAVGVVYRPRRRRWPWLVLGVVVLAAIAWGLNWYRELQARQVVVPNLVGLSLDEANERLDPADWNVEVERVRRDGAPAGEVLDQSRTAGRVEVAPVPITLTVSSGATVVQVPQVVGLSEADAVAAIEQASLVVGTVERPHDTAIAAGTVVAATPREPVDGGVPRRSAVDLVISAGPPPTRVPRGLIGRPEAAVVAAVEDAGLVVVRHEEPSEDIEAGHVTRTSPSAQAEAPPGSDIDVWVSTGPIPTVVPDVVGRSVAEATAVLSAAGYPVVGVSGPTSGTVTAMDPAAGTTQDVGTPIRLQSAR